MNFIRLNSFQTEPMPNTPMPAVKPANPNFSSGPCAKRPGYDVGRLDLSVLGRSHRSAAWTSAPLQWRWLGGPKRQLAATGNARAAFVSFSRRVRIGHEKGGDRSPPQSTVTCEPELRALACFPRSTRDCRRSAPPWLGWCAPSSWPRSGRRRSPTYRR